MARELPRDHRAPVVREQGRLACAGGVDQASDVFQQVLDRVVCQALRPLGLSVATQVRCPGAIAERRQQWQLVSPREAELRKAVEAQREPIPLAADVDVEIESVRAHALLADLLAHRQLAGAAWGPRSSLPGIAPVGTPFSKITSPAHSVAR